MDTSNETITAALEVLGQKVAELELSLDAKEHFLTEYKKYISEIAILNGYLKAKNDSESYELALNNLLNSISEH
jgi:hypothetical protein